MRIRRGFYLSGMVLWVFTCLAAMDNIAGGKQEANEAKEPPETLLHCTGKVVSPDGQPVEGVAVTFYLFEYYTTSTLYDVVKAGEHTTGAEGTFAFDVGKKEDSNRYGLIIAQKENYALGWTNWNVNQDEDVAIKLTRQAAPLAGMVVDEADQPIPDATVSIYMLLVRDENNRHYLTSKAAPDLLTTKTDSAGKFRFGVIPEGATAEFCAQAPGRATINTFISSQQGGEDLHYQAGQSDIKLVLPAESKIQGVVVEAESGQPVEGVKLMALQERNRPSFGQEPAVTQADGTFAFANLPAGTHYVILVPQKEGLPEWTGKEVEVITEAGKTTGDIKVEISKGGLLEVVVRDSKSKELVAGASLSVFQVGTQLHVGARTDAAGTARFRLPPGQCMVQNVWKKGYEQKQQQQPATVEYGKTARVEMQLQSMPMITGVVRDPEGNPVEGATIRILPGGGQSVQTNAEGKFSTVFQQVNWGSEEDITYGLLVRHLEKNLAATQELDEENLHVELTLSRGITFTGNVVDNQGKGIAGADIRIWLQLSNWGSMIEDGRRCTQTDAQGHFQVNALPPCSRFGLDAQASGYGKKNLDIESDDAREGMLDVGTLALPLANLTVSGTVVDTEDKPLAKVEISAYGEDQPDRQSITSDKDGKFTIPNVCAGRIQLSAYSRGNNSLRGYIETEGGVTGIKLVMSEESPNVRYAPKQPPSLLGQSLPALDKLNLPVAGADIEDKPVLLCFFDVRQRPSRHYLLRLAQQQAHLSQQGIVLLAVQTSPVEENTLSEWTKKQDITFPVGSILESHEETCFNWGVRSLPWFILTDADHQITSEGSDMSELEKKLATMTVTP